jgi:succinate dehydrogenase / fumarate reductase membrane anchor subunit
METGSKRRVVGAHYGATQWIAQRVTATVIAAYALLLFIVLFVAHRDFGYEGWAGLFSNLAMKLFTLAALLALFYHAWIGVRDIWMDYIKPAGLRLALHTLTILWLVLCALWSVQILWRV